MKKLFSLLLVSALVFGGIMFTSCDSGADAPIIIPLVQSKTINPNSAKTATDIELFADLSVSKAADFSAVNVTVIPSDARVKVYCNTDVVSLIESPKEVDDSWVVKFKPKKQGTFKVTAESGSVKKTIEIKVTSKIESIEVTGKTDPIDKGSTVQLKAKKNPSDSPATVTWASSDTNVATVNQSGLVTAVGPGVAVITATATDEETDTYYGADVVAGYFDVTVKGFFLSDTFFFLGGKEAAKNEIVEAKIVGIEGGTVEWTPDESGVFAVTKDPDDDKKATLSYVPGEKGEGTVKATLTASDGKIYEATAKVLVAEYFMLALGDSIAAGYAPKAMGGKVDDKDLEESDFVAAYNKYMDRRKDQTVDPNDVNEFCYSYLLYKKYKDAGSNMRLNSYAMSGDNTQMLLDKLKDTYCDGTIATKQGEILEAVKDADCITLCIGANDILLKVFGTDLITRDATWFEKVFKDELPKFKERYDQIIETLTANGQHVYAMSIFSPYKHFTSTPDHYIPAAQFNGSMKFWINKIVKINEYAEPVIKDINKYIKEKAESMPTKMTYVEVADIFDNMDNAEHKTYLNPVPEMLDFAKIIYGFGKEIPIWFDPHPRKAGAQKIADAFKSAMEG